VKEKRKERRCAWCCRKLTEFCYLHDQPRRQKLGKKINFLSQYLQAETLEAHQGDILLLQGQMEQQRNILQEKLLEQEAKLQD
jgi:hypothetical protein